MCMCEFAMLSLSHFYCVVDYLIIPDTKVYCTPDLVYWWIIDPHIMF